MIKKILRTIFKHKIITGIIIVALAGAGYFAYGAFKGKISVVRYVTSVVEKGTIIAFVSGTGQISASNEVGIKPKAAGDLMYLGIKNGQDMKVGGLIARIDPTDAQKSVNDAQVNLDQAQLDLEKMQGLETDLGRIRSIKEKAQDALDQTYEDGFNTVTNAFLSLPAIMTGLQGILFDYTTSRASQNIDYYADSANTYNSAAPRYKTNAYNSYQAARTAYDKNFNDYKLTNRFSSKAEIEFLINETYETLKDVATAVKDVMNLVQLYQDELTKRDIAPNAISNTHLSSLNGYTNTTNSYLSALLSTETAIETDKENLIETDYTVADQKIRVIKMQDALAEAKKNLSYCWVYAPFSGQITTVDVKRGDLVSTGTTIATIVTKQMIAEISLNEVDVAKVKIGQKVTLTFDAIEGLSLTGEVGEIDVLGTTNQGVVNYNVKIVFDTQDDRVKPGMSVSASIISDVKQSVLVVPNAAIKQQGEQNYVEIMIGGKPQQKIVELGLTDDTNMEITNGLQAGDEVITQTIVSGATQAQSPTQSGGNFRIPGIQAGGFGR